MTNKASLHSITIKYGDNGALVLTPAEAWSVYNILDDMSEWLSQVPIAEAVPPGTAAPVENKP